MGQTQGNKYSSCYISIVYQQVDYWISVTAMTVDTLDMGRTKGNK